MYGQKSISVSVISLVLLVCLIAAVWGGSNVAKEASAGLDSRPVIVLDAGHGGMDGGAVGNNGSLEKDVNLSITLKLRDFLTAFGWQVVLTRDTDTSIHDTSAGTIREQKISDKMCIRDRRYAIGWMSFPAAPSSRSNFCWLCRRASDH